MMLAAPILYRWSRPPEMGETVVGTASISESESERGLRPDSSLQLARTDAHARETSVVRNWQGVERLEATPESLQPEILRILRASGGKLPDESDLPSEIAAGLEAVRGIERAINDLRDQSQRSVARLQENADLSPELKRTIAEAADSALAQAVDALALDAMVARERVRFLTRTAPGIDVDAAFDALERIKWDLPDPPAE